MSPNQRGSSSHLHDTFLSAQYLINQWVDSYQICIAILLGQDDGLLRFW